MAYRCATCGSSDLTRFMRCDHPGCLDGRDRCDHGVSIYDPCASCALRAQRQLGRPRADAPDPGAPWVSDDWKRRQSPHFPSAEETALRRERSNFINCVIAAGLGSGAMMVLSPDRETWITGIAIFIASAVAAVSRILTSALHRPK